MRSFSGPEAEGPALRRAAILLERVRQDEADSEIELLLADVASIQSAIAAGRPVPAAALDRMERVVATISVSDMGTRGIRMQNVIRSNAMLEMRELLARLGSRAVRRSAS